MATPPRKTKPNPMMSPEPEKWTWQMAEEALAKNVANRHLRSADVAKYARMMKEKLWGAGEAKANYRAATNPLVFDWDGNLIDGQHRLHAQVRSKTTQYWYVLRDVPPETQKNIDTGLSRSTSDALKFAGYANYIVLASVGRWAWLLEQGQAGNGKIKVGQDEILDMVERHPDLVHSASMGQYARTGFIPVYPTPMGAAHWWIAQYNDHAEADMFVDRFVHMNREPDGSAILALLKRFTQAREKSEHIQTRNQIAMIVKAWNLDVERAYVQRMPARSRTGEYMLPEVAVREVSQEDTFGPLSDAEFDSGEYDENEEFEEGEEEEPDESEESA
jgi:hypothetical protein